MKKIILLLVFLSACTSSNNNNNSGTVENPSPDALVEVSQLQSGTNLEISSDSDVTLTPAVDFQLQKIVNKTVLINNSSSTAIPLTIQSMGPNTGFVISINRCPLSLSGNSS